MGNLTQASIDTTDVGTRGGYVSKLSQNAHPLNIMDESSNRPASQFMNKRYMQQTNGTLPKQSRNRSHLTSYRKVTAAEVSKGSLINYGDVNVR